MVGGPVYPGDPPGSEHKIHFRAAVGCGNMFAPVVAQIQCLLAARPVQNRILCSSGAVGHFKGISSLSCLGNRGQR